MEIYRIFCFLVVLIIHALRLVRGALLKMASRCWNYFLTSYIFFLVYILICTYISILFGISLIRVSDLFDWK